MNLTKLNVQVSNAYRQPKKNIQQNIITKKKNVNKKIKAFLSYWNCPWLSNRDSNCETKDVYFPNRNINISSQQQ